MSFLAEVYAQRRKLAEVLNEYLGIRKLVEQLYPDRAHFIYELLQNAEDTGATEASFLLQKTCLTFEHNGRPFNEEDVRRITDIGQSAKEQDQDKIGRFGVGFKAVFAYSETPCIWSPTFSFKITNLVLPSEIKGRDAHSVERTRFQFPFNNPKKSADNAYSEIETGLTSLAETTLLFLTNLEVIHWATDDIAMSEVRRVHHSDNHVEVTRLRGSASSSVHFLKFDRPVEGLEKQRVAVAFALDFLPAVREFDPQVPLSKQMKIIPAEPGRVAVFFPAEKETSGLRFHLHAPFVPEVSRASIKESAANDPLFRQLAQLVAEALHGIRDLGLLSVDFLGVLPNPQEQIAARYLCIRSTVVAAMNESALTPTHSKSHAPAKELLQAKASLKELLTENDLQFLAGNIVSDPKWCVTATQRNSNADRFIAGLAVHEWDFDQFLEVLRSGTRETAGPRRGQWVVGPDADFMRWLAIKSAEWHQRLYALLYTELSPRGAWRSLVDARIVRLRDGTYSTAAMCFFPTEDTREDEVLPRVDLEVYSAGRSKSQQEHARKLLESVGVREVGEAEHVESILRQRFAREKFRPLKQDLKRFISLVEKDSTRAAIFREYCIFECTDGKWRRPRDIFLDEPFLDTGLSVYYRAQGEQAVKYPLASAYTDYGVSMKRITKFAMEVGAQTQLLPTTTQCRWNPEYSYLRAVPGERYTSPIDRDFNIPGMEVLLARPTESIARFLWRTMSSLPPHGDYLFATFQKSGAGGARRAHSQVVHQLRKAAWIPQGEGVFVKPEDALSTLLPAGFAFDAGARWLTAIEFGKVAALSSENQRQKEVVARELGFRDRASLERAKRFASLPPDEQERILTERESAQPVELPEHEPTNPERRAERVGLRAAAAPERRTEERLRSVSVGRDEVKDEARQYLQLQYTNPDGEMICQICKHKLPFRLDDGSDYFEAIEFLPALVKRHHQNCLALCPNHAAMFQYANAALESLSEAFGNLSTNELSLVLAQKQLSIYFTKTHIADLKEVIRVDSDAVQMKNN
jgi:hypothetical protein